MQVSVSVIVPVHNVETYLPECLESLNLQTLQNMEILLVDDGSVDASGAICDRFAEDHPLFRVFHKPQGGVSSARNLGLEHARGEYVGFVDADDTIVPHMFETLYNTARERQADVVMCGYYISKGADDCTVLQMKYEPDYVGHEKIRDGLSALYSTRSAAGLKSVWNKLFDNNLLHTHQLRFDEGLKRAEDAWFVFDTLKVCQHFAFVDEPLYIYRQVETSAMHTMAEDRYERSKTFRQRLAAENQSLGIQPDPRGFWTPFLYETVLYCRQMIIEGKEQLAKQPLHDSYFRGACRYLDYLPSHVKMICLFARYGMYAVSMALLKQWAKKA